MALKGLVHRLTHFRVPCRSRPLKSTETLCEAYLLTLKHQPEGQGPAEIPSRDGGWWLPSSCSPFALVKPAGAAFRSRVCSALGWYHLYTPVLFCPRQQAPSSGSALPYSRAPTSLGGELSHAFSAPVWAAPIRGCPFITRLWRPAGLTFIPASHETITMERQFLADCHPHSIA